MAASSIAKLGMPISCEARPANPMPVPSPSSAVTIGRPIASSEPKVMNRMIMAASRPTAVAVPSDGFCACSIASPPSCTSSCVRTSALGRGDDVFDRRFGQDVGAFVEVDRGERDLPVGRHRVRARGRVGADHARHVGKRCDLLQHRFDLRAHRRVGDLPFARPQHDLVGIAGLGREVALAAGPSPAGIRCPGARSWCCSWSRPRARCPASRRAARSSRPARGAGGAPPSCLPARRFPACAPAMPSSSCQTSRYTVGERTVPFTNSSQIEVD